MLPGLRSPSELKELLGSLSFSLLSIRAEMRGLEAERWTDAPRSRRASLAPAASLSTLWLPVFLRPSLHENGDLSLVSSGSLKRLEGLLAEEAGTAFCGGAGVCPVMLLLLLSGLGRLGVTAPGPASSDTRRPPALFGPTALGSPASFSASDSEASSSPSSSSELELLDSLLSSVRWDLGVSSSQSIFSLFLKNRLCSLLFKSDSMSLFRVSFSLRSTLCFFCSVSRCSTRPSSATSNGVWPSLFLTSMSQRASARMEQASFTPQCAAACSGVQPS